MYKNKNRDIVGGREQGFTRGLSHARKFIEYLIFFLKQKTRDKSRRSGTGWAFMSKQSWGDRNQ